MSEITNKPHDEFFKAALGRKELATAYLREFLPEEIVQKLKLRRLKLDNGSFITDKLREVFSDIVYTCPYGAGEKEILLTFLLEHKSSSEKYPHLQLLRYMLEIWESQVKQKEAIKPVLPIVFYHGKRKWKRRAFEDYFIPFDESLSNYIPGFEYHLTDLSEYTDEDILQIRQSFLANALLILKHAWDEEYLLKRVTLVFPRIDSQTDGPNESNFLRAMFVYYFKITDFSVNETIEIMEQLSKPVKEIAKSTYDRFVEMGLKVGMERGEVWGDRCRSRIVAHNLYNEGMPIERISNILELPVKEIRKLLKEKGNEVE